MSSSTQTPQYETHLKVPLTATERHQLRHLNHSKYEGSSNLVSVVQYQIKTNHFEYDVFKNHVRSVIDAIQRRHPLLQCSIINDRGSFDVKDVHWYFIKRNMRSIPIRETRSLWQEAAKWEMNTSYTLDGPFMRVSLCYDTTLPSNCICIIFCFHHVVCDASSGAKIVQDFSMLVDLFDHTTISNERNDEILRELTDTETRPVPLPIQDQAPHQYVKNSLGVYWFFTKLCAKLIRKCGINPHSGFPLNHPLPERRLSDFIDVVLARDVTRSLLNQCRARSVSMTNLLHAALVYRCVELLKPNRSKAIHIPVPITADLRKNCPISSTNEDVRFLSSCIIAFMKIPPKDKIDIWELAASSHTELKKLIEDPELAISQYQSLFLTSKFPQEDVEHFPLLFGNLGVIDILDGDQMRAVVQHCSYSTQGTTNQIYACSFTVDGQLTICLSFNSALKQEYVHQYAESIKFYLEKLGQNHPTS